MGSRLGVVSRQLLVVEAARFVLRASNKQVHGILWHPPVPLHHADIVRFDVGILIDDLSTRDAVAEAGELLASTGRPWLVVTEHPPGPGWGALLVSGRVLVRDAACGVEEIIALAELLADPERELVHDVERLRLITEWSEWNAGAAEFHERLQTLSRRERTVLERIDGGLSATKIAHELGVSTGTIRTQVKSLRRKLGVDSQLAAVAALHFYGGAKPEVRVEPILPRPRAAAEDPG